MLQFKKIFALATTLLSGCVSLPDGVKPVTEFDLERYIGHWYEIARLDHPFERGLNQVSAEYSIRDDGTVRVINRGYNEEQGKWKEAEGKARLVGKSNEGFLKVSFFGPFYASYIIFELDHENYSYAMISGPDKSFLWILSRKAELENEVLNKLIDKARNLGFATQNLIFVEQSATE